MCKWSGAAVDSRARAGAGGWNRGRCRPRRLILAWADGDAVGCVCWLGSRRSGDVLGV